MRRTAIKVAGERGRAGGGAAPAFGGGEGGSVEEGEAARGFGLDRWGRLVASDNDLFFAWLPA